MRLFATTTQGSEAACRPVGRCHRSRLASPNHGLRTDEDSPPLPTAFGDDLRLRRRAERVAGTAQDRQMACAHRSSEPAAGAGAMAREPW